MSYPASELVIDPVLMRKYDLAGARSTSYPTADRFVEAFGGADYEHWLARRNIGGIRRALSLYVHPPLCDTICNCACNKGATRDHGRCAKYSNYLVREMALVAERLGAERRVSQLRFGDGALALFASEEMRRLCAAIGAEFDFVPNAERSIEVDACRLAPARMREFAGLGFNRVSIGVQDLEATDRRAARRSRSDEALRGAIDEARASGFRSVGLDLTYGQPKQTLDSFHATLERVLALDPDRIALSSRAHLPVPFPRQRRGRDVDLPAPETQLQIRTLAIGRLARAGYLYIGMDHFAKPGDELAVAQCRGRLQRSLQGYSTLPECDLLGFGISAIGRVGPTYCQNVNGLDDYCAALDAERLPVWRGLELSADDLVRQAVIQALACHFRVSIDAIEDAHLIDFRRAFAAELEDLKRLADDGLVEIQPEWIVVTPRGRLLVRAVCRVFDRYLRERRERAGCPRVI